MRFCGLGCRFALAMGAKNRETRYTCVMTQQGNKSHVRCIDCAAPCDPERNPLRCLPCQLDAETEENVCKIDQLNEELFIAELDRSIKRARSEGVTLEHFLRTQDRCAPPAPTERARVFAYGYAVLRWFGLERV